MDQELLATETRWGEFQSALVTERYLVTSGQKPEANTEAVYTKYADVSRQETVAAVQAAIDKLPATAPPVRRRRLHRLLYAVVSDFVERQVAAQVDELTTLSAGLVVSSQGEGIPLHRVAQRIAMESDRDKRLDLHEQHAAVVRTELAPRAVSIWQSRQRAAQDLGYPGYVHLFARLKGLSLQDLARDARSLLDATEDAHRAALADLLQTYAGVLPEGACSADLGYALRAAHQECGLQVADTFSAIHATLAGLGISPEETPGLQWDIVDRPGKHPRAYLFAINPPSQAVICCRPAGGLDDVRTLLHETGHGLHVSFTDPALPVSLRLVPSYVVTETFAFLFESLIYNPAWLTEVLGVPPQGAYRMAAAQQLYRRCLVRQYAGSLLYDLILGEGISERIPVQFSRLLSAATLVQHDPAFFLTRVDPELYAACYFQAWSLEAQIRERVWRAYGPRWWRSKGLGRHLRSIWRRGQNWSPEELAQEFGTRGVTVDALIGQMNEALTSASTSAGA